MIKSILTSGKIGVLEENSVLSDAISDMAMFFSSADKPEKISDLVQVVAYYAGRYNYDFDETPSQRTIDFSEMMYNSSDDIDHILVRANSEYAEDGSLPYVETISRGQEIVLYSMLIKLLAEDVDKQ